MIVSYNIITLLQMFTFMDLTPPGQIPHHLQSGLKPPQQRKEQWLISVTLTNYPTQERQMWDTNPQHLSDIGLDMSLSQLNSRHQSHSRDPCGSNTYTAGSSIFHIYTASYSCNHSSSYAKQTISDNIQPKIP